MTDSEYSTDNTKEFLIERITELAKEQKWCAKESLRINNKHLAKITELEAEVSEGSDLWDDAMNAVQRCARKEAWHDEHPLLRFHHTKAIKEQGK